MKNEKSYILRWNHTKIVRLGLVLIFLSIISIFYVDQSLTQYIHETFNGRLDSISRLVTWFGLGDTYFLISALGYLIARLCIKWLTHLSLGRRLAEAKAHFAFMFISFSVSGILVIVLKSIFGRSRPYKNPEFFSLNFQPFNIDWDFQSYPSGHTQVGFTLATFLSILYPKFTWYFYLFATLVGISRIILEKHFLGDVLAGAYIGVLGTYIAWNWKGRSMLNSFIK